MVSTGEVQGQGRPRGRAHSFVATNPCHVYDLALALFSIGRLGGYLSGYPRWKLRPPEGFPLQAFVWRTLVTYGLQRLPEAWRPADSRVFEWQDAGFDRAAARSVISGGYLHGLPGQCLEVFRRCRREGIATVLNHASGPLAMQRQLVAPEYERAGINLATSVPVSARLTERLAEEAALADFHCVASSIVREQLIASGLPAERIWVVAYGADEQRFAKRQQLPNGPFRICFAARQSLRKGVYYLLRALELVDSTGWELHCVGMSSGETTQDFARFAGPAKVIQHGAVAQSELAELMRGMDVLVLPSAEEAFGLVVVQALSCGVPCLVSDRVGAKDLIRNGENGAIVPFGDIAAWASALQDWSTRRILVPDRFPWQRSAESLLRQADAACQAPVNGIG